MAPTTRQAGLGSGYARSTASQPRRKTSQSSSQQVTDSWELIEPQSAIHNHGQHVNGDGDGDGMEIETSSSNRLSAADSVVHPLRDMAERVGREVELFAEKLDTWKPGSGSNSSERRSAAINLADDYRKVANEVVSRLQKQHGSEQKDLLRKRCARSRKSSNHGTEGPKDRTAEDDIAEEFDPRAKTTVKDLEQWQAELTTWTLVCNIFDCRYSELDEEEQARQLAFSNENDRFMADGEPWIEFLAASGSTREKLVVIRWLEEIAELTGEDLDIIEQELEEGSEGKGLFGHGWMETREKLKGEKRLRLWDTPIDSGVPEIKNSAGTELLVTQLDYDAANRLDLTLEKADRDYERSFYIMCWEMFKRGRTMDDVHEWCADRHEFARAISLGAHPLEDLNSPPALSIALRFRWRQTCGSLSQLGGLSEVERAVYGILSGDHGSSERGCKNWDEHLWASYNSQLLDEYTAHLMKHHADEIPSTYKTEYPNVDTISSDDRSSWTRTLMASLQLKKPSHLDAAQPLKLIQASIISHDIQDFAMRQGVALSRRTRHRATRSHKELVPPSATQLVPDNEAIISITDDPNALRILCHLILIFQNLDTNFGSGERLLAVENVLCSYIDFLRLSGKFSLIPLYVSMLSRERASIAMARVLFDVVNTDERIETVHLMEAAGLDVVAILRLQYEFAMEFSPLVGQDEEEVTGVKILGPTKDDMWPGQRISAYQGGELLADEDILVRSLQWFMLVQGHWAMSFAAFTDVAKLFLRFGRLDAASDLFHRIPFSEVSMLFTSSQLGKRVDIMDDHEGSDEESTPPLRRSARTRPLFKAQRGPRSSTPQRNKVLRDLLKHHARTYFELSQLMTALEALWSWRIAEDEQLRAVDAEARQHSRVCLDDLISAMEPIMHDFLHHAGPADTSDQLKQIRHIYLPEMIMGYISALHSAGHLLTREHLLAIMSLATEIADNEDIIECFTATRRMPELVDAFATTSKTMLRLNEEASKSGKKKRLKVGRNLGMWEISA